MCSRHVVAGKGFLCKDSKDVSASARRESWKSLDTYKTWGSFRSTGAGSQIFRVETWRSRLRMSSNASVEAALRRVQLEHWYSSHLHRPRSQLEGMTAFKPDDDEDSLILDAQHEPVVPQSMMTSVFLSRMLKGSIFSKGRLIYSRLMQGLPLKYFQYAQTIRVRKFGHRSGLHSLIPSRTCMAWKQEKRSLIPWDISDFLLLPLIHFVKTLSLPSSCTAWRLKPVNH